MRIAFLCKRQYMSKDVIIDRYARLYEIPFQLARLGHEVRGYCLSYQGHPQGTWSHEAAPGSLLWKSRSLGRLRVPALASYPWRMLDELRRFKPDLVIGASDIPQVSLSAWLAGRLGVPFVADLYDNFEGFGQARLPGMKRMLRRAVRGADLVTTTSEPLRELVVDSYGARGVVIAMPSTIDKSVFKPMAKTACRKALGLPADGRFIGTAGGLYPDKGIGVVYEAWQLLQASQTDLHLVLAGPHAPELPPPEGPNVHYLGALRHDQVAGLFNALDVGIMSILDTPFGRYCFPQKAYEMLACELPVVATDVGAMSALFEQTPECLFQAGNARSLADALRSQIEAPVSATRHIDDWPALIGDLEKRLSALVNASPA
ncbi:MAG: glycosyltransferase family 4 protein [Rhodanobacteraceae bacterium]